MIVATCRVLGLAAVPAAMMAAAPAFAANAPLPKGDATRGATLFAQCKICHSIDAGKNMVGPSLNHIVGTKAGDVPGYTFSPAMKKSGIKWTSATLSEFLTAPMKKVPGTKMAFAGLAKPQDRADVIAFLAKN
jgi:cytochrome c2